MNILRLLTARLEGTAAQLDLDISFDEAIDDVSLVAERGFHVVIGRIFGFEDDLSCAFTYADNSGRFAPNLDVGALTPRNQVLEAVLDGHGGNRLTVRYRVEERDVLFAPALVLWPRVQPVQPSVSVSVTTFSNASSSSGSLGTNTIQQSQTCCYIAQPTNYTGDKWHIAAALVLNANYKVIILKRNQSGDEKGLAAGYSNFYTRVGVGALKILHGAASGKMRQIGQAYWPKRAKEYADKDPDALVKKATKIVRMTFASTSGILKAVEERGVARVVRELRAAFLSGFDDQVARRKILARLAPLQGNGRYLLVNMRCSHYHFEHNITQAIYQQIEAAAGLRGITVIRVGIFEPGFSNHERFGAWMQGFNDATYGGRPIDQRFIDIYGYREERQGFKVDELETAFLWATVAGLQNVVGIIGGRSGSLDIAAFMGVRTFSWDIVDNDPEYIRMLLAFPLMSCGRRQGLGQDGRGRPGKQDAPSEALLAGLLEPLALELWLAGEHVIPDHGPSYPIPRDVVEKQLEFEPLRYLDWMLDSERDDEEEEDDDDEKEQKDDGGRDVQPVYLEWLDQDETYLTTTAYGILDVGQAVDDGDCFFDCLWQLLPAPMRPVNTNGRGDLRTFLADYYRDTLNRAADSNRIRQNSEYATLEDIDTMAAALNAGGASIRLVAHFCAYGHRDAVPMETGADPYQAMLHMLFQVDADNNGHISPLT